MTALFDQAPAPPEEPRGGRLARFGLAAVVTLLLLGLALGLGDWAYRQRRLSLHETRLQRALEQQPTLASLTQGLEAEPGVVLLGAGFRPQAEPVAGARAWAEERSDGAQRPERGDSLPARAAVDAPSGDPLQMLERLTAGRPGAARDAVLARAREAPAIALFRVEDDLIYATFGDADGRFVAFAIVVSDREP